MALKTGSVSATPTNAFANAFDRIEILDALFQALASKVVGYILVGLCQVETISKKIHQ